MNSGKHIEPACCRCGKHHDRMPMMLDPKDFNAWLDGTAGVEVLKPAPEDSLRESSVSKREQVGAGRRRPYAK